MAGRFTSLVPTPLRALSAYHVPRPPTIRAKLDANESPFVFPEHIASELGRVLSQVELNRYPLADCAELRALLAREHAVAPASLVFGNGSDELIAMLIAAFSHPREGRTQAAVLYPSPTFSVYRLMTVAAGAEPVEVPLTADMAPDVAAVESAVTSHRPNLVFFASPNNPTGTTWPIAAVLRLARANPDTLVVHDEAYIDYGGESLVDEVASVPNLIVMRTMSKIGLAGLRIGYLTAHADVVTELEKVRPPYNIGALNQAAAVWLLDNHRAFIREACQRVVAERDGLADALAALPDVRVFRGKANLVLIRVGQPGDGKAGKVWHALAKRGVMVRNLDVPGPLAGCLRVTIGTAAENQLLVEELTEVLK